MAKPSLGWLRPQLPEFKAPCLGHPLHRCQNHSQIITGHFHPPLLEYHSLCLQWVERIWLQYMPHIKSTCPYSEAGFPGEEGQTSRRVDWRVYVPPRRMTLQLTFTQTFSPFYNTTMVITISNIWINWPPFRPGNPPSLVVCINVMYLKVRFLWGLCGILLFCITVVLAVTSTLKKEI